MTTPLFLKTNGGFNASLVEMPENWQELSEKEQRASTKKAFKKAKYELYEDKNKKSEDLEKKISTDNCDGNFKNISDLSEDFLGKTPTNPTTAEQKAEGTPLKQAPRENSAKTGQASQAQSHKKRYTWTPIDHPDRTKFMSENYQKQFNKLHKHDQYLLKLFWGLKGKTRFCVLSYSEIGKLLGLSRKSAISFMARLVKAGIIEKKTEFMKKHVRQEDGSVALEESKIHRRNYYLLTKIEGRKSFNNILKFLKGLPQKDLHSSGVLSQGEGATSLRSEPPVSGAFSAPRFSFLESLDESNPVAFENTFRISDLFAGVATLLGSSARSARAHEWRSDGVVSSKSRRVGKVFVRVVWEDLERKEFGKKLTKRDRKKAHAIKRVFKKYGLWTAYLQAYLGMRLKMLSWSLTRLTKALKLMRNKLNHKWKLKSFWAFFSSLMTAKDAKIEGVANREKEKPAKIRTFFRQHHHDVIDCSHGINNKISEGVDTKNISEGLREFRTKSGKDISAGQYQHLVLKYGVQGLAAGLDRACYRMGLEGSSYPMSKQESEKFSQEAKKLAVLKERADKGRPILKMVKLNQETKEVYSDEDFANNAPSTMAHRCVGYEPIRKEDVEAFKIANNQAESNRSSKNGKASKIRSPYGFLGYILRITGGNLEKLTQFKFGRREDEGKTPEQIEKEKWARREAKQRKAEKEFKHPKTGQSGYGLCPQ